MHMDECWGCVLRAISKEIWNNEDSPLSQNGIRLKKGTCHKKHQMGA